MNNTVKQAISRNPATEMQLAAYTYQTSEEINQKIIAANKTWEKWRDIPLAERIPYIKKLGELLRSKNTENAKLITQEMGKPITQATAEINKCALLCDYYAAHAAQHLAPQNIAVEKQKAQVIYQPLGVILGVMPWNFPFWQVMRFAVPTLLAGNTCLLKHASNVTGCSLAIEQLFKEAEFPTEAFISLIIASDQVAEVIAHPFVAAVSLTGSEAAGKQIAAEAGKALKKTVLELGGSDPYIILADADLEKAALAIVASRFGNAGQSCIAAKRILAVDEIREPLQKRIIEIAKSYACGDPELPETKMGPLAREDLRMTLQQQVSKSIAMGAKLECGGVIPSGTGYYYPATILTEVPQNCPAYAEELFGPVISFIPVKDAAEAIAVANATTFGLSSAVFSNNIESAKKLSEKLQAGSVTINHFTISDPNLPFGGVKHSGFGRELSAQGIREFTNIKTIVIYP